MLIRLNTPRRLPRIMLAALIQVTSTAQARKRLIGPASSWEKRIPSGVRMSRVLVLLIGFTTGAGQKHNQQNELEGAESNFHPIGNHRLMILRKERFNKSRPHQHDGDTPDQRNEVR